VFTSIDTSTLVLLTITVAFGLGAISIALTFHHSGTRGTRGLRHWGRGLVVYSVGTLLLYLVPRFGAPLLYAGWLCVLYSMLVMYRALLRICGTEGHRTRFSVAVVGGTVLTWIYFAVVDPNPVRQVDATSVAIAVIAGRAAWDLWRYAMRSRFRAPAYTVLAWLLLTSARPLLEVLTRDSQSGTPDPLPLFGPPGMIFFRVLVLALLSISVIWLEISRLYEAVEDQATRDELTGVANRRAIVALLERELARARRLNTPCSIALFDIDHFKHINDTLGHPAGDQVIKWVTDVIGKSIRPYDALGRYGGEEFLLLMPGARPEAGVIVAERARAALEKQECFVDGKPLRITISAGVAAWSEEIDADTLFRAADQALYRAKQGGRNRIVLARA
jgi:diguanylate cyclase (GGDEF)-like protein